MLQAGRAGLNTGLIVRVSRAAQTTVWHNGRALVSDRYKVEIDEEGDKWLNIGITLSAR